MRGQAKIVVCQAEVLEKFGHHFPIDFTVLSNVEARRGKAEGLNTCNPIIQSRLEGDSTARTLVTDRITQQVQVSKQTSRRSVAGHATLLGGQQSPVHGL